MTEPAPAVLIVDDEAMVVTALRSFLELETPYRVVTHTRPRAALEALESEPAAVVLADFMMPEMDGITLLRHVRARWPATTRILLTGYADKANAIRAINEAALYHYLEKPWDNDRLKIVLRNAVERADLLGELERRLAALEEKDSELQGLRRRLLEAFL